MPSLFVTGAGTGVGKTLVTAALAHQARTAGRPVAAIKPVISGYTPADMAESDAGILLAAQGKPVDAAGVNAIAPWRFTAPLAADMAAAHEGRGLDMHAVVAFCRRKEEAAGAGGLLIEGVGGVMAPMSARTTVLDWVAALACPAILVTGSYLGALSHALTARAALLGRGVPLAAIVVSETEGSGVALDDTVAALNRHAAEPMLAVPRLAGSEPWRTAPDLSAVFSSAGWP